MHEDVTRLVREERLAEAAACARALGDLKTASELFERACDWSRASEAALEAGDAGRALTLAALGNCDPLAEAALHALEKSSAPQQITHVADGLSARAHHAWAARTYELARATDAAADAWLRAGDRARAARLLEVSGGGGQGVARAARLLEAGLRQEPDRVDLLVALGGLMLRCGKPAPALRALQRVPEGAPEKREAVELSVLALTELGMTDAKAEAVALLAALGGPRPHAVVETAATQAPATRDGSVTRARLYGRYEVMHEVSSTATARLLECRDVLRDERVAVKLFSPQGDATRGAGRDALMRFMREARVLGQLAHPNVVPLREVFEQGPALVLDWMAGGTLEETLAAERFTPARAVDVACAVLGALGEAHRLGVVHRDIKPANILFDAAGTARLSDFGVSHLGDLSVTATAGSFGSLAYMSPEQREGRPATPQSDLYGMGILLVEMLTGSRPSASEAARLPPLVTVHRQLGAPHDAALASLLAREASLRPGDAFSAARSLSALAWPSTHDVQVLAAPRVSKARPTSVPPPAQRLERSPDGRAPSRDRWLDRAVVCAPLTARSLARATTFARVGHRALQTLTRVDREEALLWLGCPRGAALTRPLAGAERARLEDALVLLHAAGFVHGRITRDAVLVGEDGVVLLFEAEGSLEATAETDRLALAAL